MHAGLGLSSIPLGPFALWVSIGLVPRAALYSYFGDSFTRGRGAVIGAGIVLAIVALTAIFVMRRMLASGGGAPGQAGSDGTGGTEESQPDSAAGSGGES